MTLDRRGHRSQKAHEHAAQEVHLVASGITGFLNSVKNRTFVLGRRGLFRFKLLRHRAGPSRPIPLPAASASTASLKVLVVLLGVPAFRPPPFLKLVAFDFRLLMAPSSCFVYGGSPVFGFFNRNIQLPAIPRTRPITRGMPPMPT